MSSDHCDARSGPTVEYRVHNFFAQIVDDDPELLPISDLYLDYRHNNRNLPE